MSRYVALGIIRTDRAHVFLMGHRSPEAIRLLLPDATLMASYHGVSLGSIHNRQALSLDLVLNVLLRSTRLPAVGDEVAAPVPVDVYWFEPGASFGVTGPFGIRFALAQKGLPSLHRVALMEKRDGRSVVLGHGAGVTERQIRLTRESTESLPDGVHALTFASDEGQPVVQDVVELFVELIQHTTSSEEGT